MVKEKKDGKGEEKNLMYIFAYFLSFISGLIVFVIANDDERLKFNALQAIALGVVAFIIGWLPIGIASELIEFLIWLFGLYLGWLAYDDEDDDFFVPYLSPWAADTVHYKLQHSSN